MTRKKMVLEKHGWCSDTLDVKYVDCCQCSKYREDCPYYFNFSEDAAKDIKTRRPNLKGSNADEFIPVPPPPKDSKNEVMVSLLVSLMTAIVLAFIFPIFSIIIGTFLDVMDIMSSENAWDSDPKIYDWLNSSTYWQRLIYFFFLTLFLGGWVDRERLSNYSLAITLIALLFFVILSFVYVNLFVGALCIPLALFILALVFSK